MDLDARIPAYLAAKLVGIPKQTFNNWRRAGKVTPDAEGNYRLGDVLEVERTMRRSPKSSRNPARGDPTDMRTNPRSHRKPTWDDRDRNTGGTSGQPAYAA